MHTYVHTHTINNHNLYTYIHAPPWTPTHMCIPPLTCTHTCSHVHKVHTCIHTHAGIHNAFPHIHTHVHMNTVFAHIYTHHTGMRPAVLASALMSWTLSLQIHCSLWTSSFPRVLSSQTQIDFPAWPGNCYRIVTINGLILSTSLSPTTLSNCTPHHTHTVYMHKQTDHGHVHTQTHMRSVPHRHIYLCDGAGAPPVRAKAEPWGREQSPPTYQR
jgi:hypothetical protein